MKKLFILTVVIFMTLSAFAQAPEKMSYQCVVRNSSGVLVTDHSVGIRVTILQGTANGTLVYQETYSPVPKTNANGLISIEIGGGTALTGIFSNINWATGPYFLKTETDPTGGTSYTIVGTSQLLSVPYALHAKTAATANYNSLSNLPALNIADWNTSYGWGNHAGLYRLIDWVPSWTDVTGKPTTTTGYGITDAVMITGDQTISGIKTFSSDLLINGLTVGIGKSNTAANTTVGNQALHSATTGYENTAIGYRALNSNTTGYQNVANGSQALRNNTTGILNTGVGDEALRINSTGNYNTATGYAALYSNTTANDNTANGVQALYWNTTGRENTGIGKGALFSNTTGQENTANGTYALYWNTTGNYNTANGYQALLMNTTGNYNTANGYQALYSNTTGQTNTAIGTESLGGNTSGNGNIAIGGRALYSNTTGFNNIAIGTQALGFNNGDGNVVIGYNAAIGSTGGYYNTAIGEDVLSSNTTGGANSAFGRESLGGNTTGNYNVAIGWLAGDYNQTGNNNVAIGCSSDMGQSNLQNSVVIGSNANVSVSNTFVLGNSSIIGWGFGVNPGAAAIRVGSSTNNGNGATLTLSGVWTNASDISKKYDIENIDYGLNEVMKLHPVTYKLKGTDNQDIGFIAQEVKKIVPEIIYGEDGQMTMSYGQLTSVLVKAIQEQQKQIDDLKKVIALLKSK
jgi:trimeric autotransporter adhesin